MARGVLASHGDPVEHGMMADYLSEQGLRSETMIEVGKCYYIETVTKYWTGRVTRVDCDWIELEDAAWIADTGRFHEFIENGTASEVEPIKSGVRQLVPVACVTGVTEWPHPLPRRAV
jgi:hypothetical protein